MLKKDNLRIAVDARELKTSHITGIGRLLRTFLDTINEEARDSIYLFTDQHTPGIPLPNSFNIIRAKAPFTLWYDQFTLARLAKKERIEVFFSPYFKIPFAARCKKVITIYDLHFLKEVLRKGFSRLLPYVSYLKQAVKSADKIITISNFSKGEIVKLLRVPEAKVKMVYIGVDKNFRVLEGSAQEILKEKYRIDFKYILCVSNMSPHKNLRGLIEAYSLIENRDEYKLIIVAKRDGNYPQLHRVVKRLGLEKEIIFWDFIPDEDLTLFYNFAEVFIFPSFYEGFGLPPLEAMACGAPVVCSAIPALKEALGESALYFDPYNIRETSWALTEMLQKDSTRGAYRNKGLEQVKKYDPQVFASRLWQELAECA